MPTTRHKRRPRNAAFTMVELMVSTTLSAIVMAAIIGSFLMMGRSAANAVNYVAMEQQARRALERFGEDVRMARDISWTSSRDVTLAVVHLNDSGTDSIRYHWDNTVGSPTYRCLLRSGPDPVTGIDETETLITHVTSLEFNRWLIGTSGAAVNNFGTKQLQIRLTILRQEVTTAATTNLVVSARFVLRNKQ